MDAKKIRQAEKAMLPFPQRLGLLLRQKGITQDELARALGKSRQSVSQYCNGAEPDFPSLVKIADYLGVTVDYLVGRENAPTHEAASIADMTGLQSYTVSALLDICDKAEGDESTMTAHRARLALESVDLFFRFADAEEIGYRLMDWGNSLSNVIEYVQSIHGAEYEAIKDSPEQLIEKWTDFETIPLSEYTERRRLQDIALGKRYALVKCIEELFLNKLEMHMVTNPATWEDWEADNGKGKE